MEKQEKVLVQLPRKKSSYNLVLDLMCPLLFIGEVLQFGDSQRFTFNGCEITVPALTSNNDQKTRTFSVAMQLAKAVFGTLEQDEVVEEGVIAEFIDALRDKGFAISHNSKAATIEGIRIWLALKKASVKNQVLATRQLNVDKFARLGITMKMNRVLTGTIKSDVQKLIEQASNS